MLKLRWNCWLPRSPQSTFVCCAVGRRYTGSNGQRGLGADIDKVIFDAMHALEAKREQLGLPSSDTEISDTCPPYDEEARSLAVVIKNRNGLHVRPASPAGLYLIDI